MNLADFNPQAKALDLSNFNQGDGAKPTAPALNEATVNNVAAYTAMLSDPSELERVYQSVTSELRSNTSSATMSRVIGQYNKLDYEANYEALQSILYSGDYTPDQKAQAVNTFSAMTGGDQVGVSLYNKVANAAIMADSSALDNAETDLVRYDTMHVIDETNYYNGMVQKIINSAAERNEATTTGTFIDNLGELFVPFMEGAASGEIAAKLAELSGDNSFLARVQGLAFLGENKASIREAIRKAPADKKLEMAKLVAQWVQESGGSATLRPNTLNQLIQLQDFLQSGNYTELDRIVDNVFSILDDTIFLIPLKILGKAAKMLPSIPNIGAMRADKAAIARFENARKALEAPQVAQDVEKALADGLEPLTNALSPTDKLAAQNAVNNIVTERLLPEVPAELVDDVRTAVQNKMADYTPIVDTKQFAQELLGTITDAASRRILAGEATAGLPDATEVLASNVARRTVRTGVSPTSVSQALKDTNPAKAQALHDAVVKDKTGRMANIAYGTTRTDAIANDLLPEIGSDVGTVRSKASIDEALPAPNQEIIESTRKAQGRIDLSPEEKAATRTQVERDWDEWRDVVGLYPRTNMSTITHSPTGVGFDMVYGPKHNGFVNAKQAIRQAEVGLAKYGVTSKDIEILGKNQNGEYEPIDLAKAKPVGNYLIRVKAEYEFAPGDTLTRALSKYENNGKLFGVVPFRLFDKTSILDDAKQGGIVQQLIPHTAVLDSKRLLNPASTASEKSALLTKRLVELGTEYAKLHHGLNTRQKYLVDNYIREANAKGLKFNSSALKAKGFSDGAVAAVRKWKEVNDTVYHFENIDYTKTMRARGWEYLVDQSNDTQVITRAVPRSRVGDGVEVYDSSLGEMRKLSKDDLDKLYAEGGTVAQARTPIKVGDDLVSMVLSPNKPGGAYMRRIRDDDSLLAYRDGYYHVSYEQPYFIEKITQRPGKDRVVEVVGTAGSRQDALDATERLTTTNKDQHVVFNPRGDIKRGTEQFADYEWGSVVASGRSAQKVRGERLKNFSQSNPDPNLNHIESPEESLIRSIASVAQRTAFRDFVETAKSRWMKQYGHLIQEQKGQKAWPNQVGLVGEGTVKHSLSDINDARWAWRYIDAMEGGYVNLLDDWSKNLFKAFSDVSSRSKSFKWLEGPMRKASDANPSTYARRKAFRFLLAANPLRQLPVQSMQALPVILATNPLFLLNGRLPAQMTLLNYTTTGGDVDSWFKVVAETMTGLKKDEAVKLMEDWNASGFEAAVEANSLTRDHMLRLTDRTVLQKTNRALAVPINIAQKYGFNMGENLLMRSVWLSEYDNLRKTGKVIDAEALENMNARVRHLTLNMNQAGELPYNHNMFSALMQFFQAPHKAFAQIVFGHTGLTTADRLKLGTSYILTFGLGMGPVTSVLSNLIPGEEKGMLREVIEGGVFNILFNKALSTLFREDVNVDFADSLRLFEVPNVAEFLMNMIDGETSIIDIIASSPSGALVVGDNPRVTEFILQAMRPFYVDPAQKPQEALNAGIEFLNIFSGASNAFKAHYILRKQESMSSSGITIDRDSNWVEAMMKLAGFSTMDEVRHYAYTDRSIKAQQKRTEDIKTWLRDLNKRLSLEGIGREDIESVSRIMSEAMVVWGDDPDALREINSQIRFQSRNGEFTVFNQLIRNAGWMTEDQLNHVVEVAPITNEEKKTLRDYLRALRESE